MDYKIKHPDVGDVHYIQNTRAKRIIISVKPEYVKVVIPRRQTFKNARNFFESRIDWIKTRTNEMKMQLKKAKSLASIDKQEARKILESRISQLAGKYGFEYNRISIRKQKTRWGSCSTKDNISLNMNLLHLPKELMDYVLLHELVHTRIKSHGKDFWHELDKVIPDSKKIDRKLKEYQYCLL